MGWELGHRTPHFAQKSGKYEIVNSHLTMRRHDRVMTTNKYSYFDYFFKSRLKSFQVRKQHLDIICNGPQSVPKGSINVSKVARTPSPLQNLKVFFNPSFIYNLQSLLNQIYIYSLVVRLPYLSNIKAFKVYCVENCAQNFLVYNWLISWDQSCCQVLRSISCYIWLSSWFQKIWLGLRFLKIPLITTAYLLTVFISIPLARLGTGHQSLNYLHLTQYCHR